MNASKKERGQFYTTNSNYIIGNLLNDIPQDKVVVEPFCGQGDLLIFDNAYEIYDIDPKIENCESRDTLRNPPDYKNKLVITNPPFYEQDLTSPDPAKNLAAHSTALSWDVLAEAAASLLRENGAWYVLVPTLRAYTMQKLALNYGLQLSDECLMYNDSKHLPIRAMLKFVKQKEATIQRNKIVIKNADQSYTTEFINYLKDYYLHL